MTTATTDNTNTKPAANWEARISNLLSTLSAVQGDLLALLTEKRKALAEGDLEQLQQINHREGELVTRLEVCHSQRQELLNAAAGQGLPAGSVRSLTASLPADQREVLEPTVEQASRQSRLLQHNSLTNWVLVQRTLIHLSQMIEIIATGGRMDATYGSRVPASRSGALVDQEV
ncbi:flagellar export chaperone FlgN [Aeoliella mucimassa]|uniref:FlgN protein n=1 Tax=Aeoliella mucimassa TaxID=2527972 RepID=A0A518ARU9_9BACT|nr:flagellar export chaperone FlgN [Aeoliella mucimassa]QDU57442.1 FlgN protein [Aeoliella mucimassa]